MKGQVVLYKAENNEIQLKVQLEEDTVWLTQAQMSALFDRDTNTVGEHIVNIFSEHELDRTSTTRKFRVVQIEGTRKITRNIEHYNLDVIISVGYRVKSLRGTQFRIWATNVLKKYLVEGYVLNQKRLEENEQKYLELQEQIKTLRNIVENETFTLSQSKELVRIISDYAKGLSLINAVDENNVNTPRSLSIRPAQKIEHEKAKLEISKLRETLKAHELFGNERANGLESALLTIFQTYNGKELYPSIEEKAVHLFYFIIKDHPFTDGNKRIGSFLFVRFLDINKLLYLPDGSRLVSEDTLVAVALLIAQSDPRDKKLMIKLVLNLLA